MVAVAGRLRYVCGCAFLFALLPCMANGICETLTKVNTDRVNSTLRLHCMTCRSEAQWHWVRSDSTLQPVHSETNGDLVLHVDLGYGGRVYSCQCESGRECHLILVKPLVRINFTPASVLREGDGLTVECSAEGYPPPQTTDFTLLHSNSELSHLLPLDSTGLGAGVQAVIPETQFQKHDGVFTCIVNVNLTQYNPTWPTAEQHKTLQGIADSQLHIYGMENISVLKSVTRNSGKVIVSSAAVECIAKLSQGLEMKWVRGEEDTPIDPKETPLQYVMFPGVELDSSGSMLYGMQIRWFGANDFGRFGCAVSFEGKVLDILYAWINETDSNRTSSQRPCLDTKTESDDEHIILLAILASLTVILLVALITISVLYVMFRKRRHCFGRQSAVNLTNETSTTMDELQEEPRYTYIDPRPKVNGEIGETQQPEPEEEQTAAFSPRPQKSIPPSGSSQGTKQQSSPPKRRPNFLRSISQRSNNSAQEPERQPLTPGASSAAHIDEEHSDSDS